MWGWGTPLRWWLLLLVLVPQQRKGNYPVSPDAAQAADEAASRGWLDNRRRTRRPGALHMHAPHAWIHV